MDQVRAAGDQASETITALGEKSQKITGIVATITGIAKQTDLLALNAAIEAARAGEHGRGFSVVAENVRQLAEQAGHAAADIAKLIEEIQSETARAVEAVETGARQTRDSTNRVNEAGVVFQQIGASVEDMSSRVEEIAAAIEEIAESGTRMQESITAVAEVAHQSSASSQQVSATTEQTSAGTEQIAASARELALTAEELERLVGAFVLS